jgi:hypothetical protein
MELRAEAAAKRAELEKMFSDIMSGKGRNGKPLVSQQLTTLNLDKQNIVRIFTT